MKAPRSARRGRTPAFPLILLAATVGFAYANGLHGPFLFDDLPNIAENLGLRHLWPPAGPNGATARPVLMESFAINYALGGLDVLGYHLANVLIHLAAACVLFDVVRRTLQRPGFRATFVGVAEGVSLAAAALWAAHPLNSQAVTYVVQRGESLASLCFLVTLDAAIVAATTKRRARAAELVAIVACVLGAATKPVVVSAPFVVLLYDRFFLFSSFREALRQRAFLYGGLATSWLVMAALALAAPDSSAGRGSKHAALAYAASQPGVVLHYLRLVVWPHPLVLDYGWPAARSVAAITLPLVALLSLAACFFVLARRRPGVAFLGLAFALLLGPTSSVFPIDDLAFEHRMYLPLAPIAVLVALAGWELLIRRAQRPALAVALVVLAVAVLGGVTLRRNLDYASEVGMWTRVTSERPENARAHNNLGRAYVRRSDRAKAEPEFVRSIELDSTYAEARSNLGSILVDRGDTAAAIPLFRRALADQPKLLDARSNLALALAGTGRNEEAIPEFRRFLERRPDDGRAWNALGNAQSAAGHHDQALASYQEAVRVQPELVAAHNNLGIMRVRLGDAAGGIAEFRAALRLEPGFTPARRNLEGALRLEAKLAREAGR